MLVDKIESCISAIEELSSMRENALSLGAFEAAVNKLSNVGDISETFVSTVEEMGQYEFCAIQYSDEDIQNLQAAIITCASAVNNMTLTKTNVASFTGLLETEKKKLTLYWCTTAKDISDPLKSLLGIIQPFAENKSEVATLITALGNGAKAEPSAAIIRSFVANVERANKISDSFQMSGSVRGFLQKAKTGKATYADITPEVADWIAEHKLKAKIKVSFL